MKIHNILNEQETRPSKNRLNFNDLSAIEVAAIRGVADGRIDFENASDRMIDVLDDLKGYGLLDNQYELTRAGLKANDLAVKHGSYEKRQAKDKNKQKPTNSDIKYAANSEYEDDEYDSRFDDDEYDGAINRSRGRY